MSNVQGVNAERAAGGPGLGVMLDLETVDTRVSAAIVSIGGVRFGPDGVAGDIFYRAVKWGDQVGRTMSSDTILWWMAQPPEVQAALRDPAAISLNQALADLSTWIGGDVEVWAGPADFDLAILKHAYEGCDVPVPWKYNRTRCYCTVRRLRPNIVRTTNTCPHNALEDARAQAEHLVLVLASLAMGASE